MIFLLDKRFRYNLRNQKKMWESILYKEGGEEQIIIWINEINSRKLYFNREKPKKEV